MLPKRPRAVYESDLHDAQFVVYGTPLGPLDSRSHHDGSYVPLHRQEARDEQGRRRLHGAFTGGWSAGYFNTVGSKEGWTPTAFVSSRQLRRPEHSSAKTDQRPEDFMDAEDLGDLAERQMLQTTDSFAGLGGGHTQPQRSDDSLARLVDNSRHTIGFKLLQKMGWRQGQGVGLSIRRTARLHDDPDRHCKVQPSETHLFAPDDVPMVKVDRKTNRSGLGNEPPREIGLAVVKDSHGLGALSRGQSVTGNAPDPLTSLPMYKKRGSRARGGALDFSSLEGTASDSDEDPYAIGPRISLTRPSASKLRKGKTSANPALASKLTFTSRQPVVHPITSSTQRGGLLPLPGFALSSREELSESAIPGSYAPPSVPPGWITSKRPKEVRGWVANGGDSFTSTPAYNPKTRAAALGEPQLPGKSVFDFMSAESRARIAIASGRHDLPQAKGEVPLGHAISDVQRMKEGLEGLPPIENDTAVAALSRDQGSRGTYADDESKQSRYRAYLKHIAFGSEPPSRPQSSTVEDYLKEMAEFNSCANLFKPMSRFMASRFTVSSSVRASPTSGIAVPHLVNFGTQAAQEEDPSQSAAKLGMYGMMTRSVVDFHPTRLLCKRFNVQPHDNGHSQNTVVGEAGRYSTQVDNHHSCKPTAAKDRRRQMTLPETRAGHIQVRKLEESLDSVVKGPLGISVGVKEASAEPQRPSDDVFRTVFGDSSDGEEMA